VQKLLTSSEVASLLGLSRETVADYAQRGALISSKIGRKWMFHPDDVQTFVRSTQYRGR